MKQQILILVVALLMLSPEASPQTPEQSVFNANRGNNSQWLSYQDNHRALYNIISGEAFRLLDQRAENIASLTTADEWKKHQTEVQTSLRQSLAKFTKTPLNAQTTATLEREDFIVEKVLFESHPGFYVTAGLFLPNQRQKPAPAVIYCAGHTELGFRSEAYQQVILNLVQKGFIVFAFDPAGQGERLQYADPESGISRIGGPTKEHSYAGVQTLLTGTSLSDYFIWDGIRVLDYLESRTEVDMNRIGITGRSGGGTQAALIAACDNRIYAAAPENYITGFRRLLQSIGPQDAEQNPWHAIVKGIDHADFLHIRAPKPALMITTTHDFFSIQGARETFAEVKRSYAALGNPENFQMVEDMGGHQSTKSNRESLYAFFQKHLNLPGERTDAAVTHFSYEELLVTPTGQVRTSLPGETIFSLNRKYYPGQKTDGSILKPEFAQHAGISFNRKFLSAVYTGKFSENDVSVEKYFLEQDKKDYALPLYIMKKENVAASHFIIWFHPHGKAKVLSDPLAMKMLEAGYAIIAADLPGTGELHDPEFSGDGVIRGIPFNYTFGANLIGKSISGIQAEAIDLILQFTDRDDRLKGASKFAVAGGSAALPLLYFACISNKFAKAAFYDFPEPVINLIEEEYYDSEEAYSAVPGSLPAFDLPELLNRVSESGTNVLIRKKQEVQNAESQLTSQMFLDFFRE